MTIPATLSGVPSPAALGGAATEGAPADGQPPADAFALLLAALAGGVVVPVPGHVVPPQLTAPDTAAAATTTVEARNTGVPAGSGPAAAPTPATLPAQASPVAWEATTQRALVPAAETGRAPAAAAPATLAPTLTTTAPLPTGAIGNASSTAQPAESASGPADPPPADTTPVRRTAGPEQTAPETTVLPETAQAILPAQAVPTAAPAPALNTIVQRATAVDGVASSHQVKPALLEAARGLRQEGGGRTSLVVRLDPPELGAVVIRLTVQDGRVDVQLRTPDVTARVDLQAQSYDVQQVLRDNGFDLTSFDVTHGDVLSGGRDDAKTPDRGTPQRHRPADGQAGNPHVTDDVHDPQAAGTWL